jgi:hypothetical protein
MSEQEIKATETAMMAIPADEVRKPAIPVEAYCHQGERIVEAAKRDREALVATGITPDAIDSLPARLRALRSADAEWLVRRTRGRPPEQVERETAGFGHRNEAGATARFGLRNDVEAQAVLDEIQKGDGVADMLDDMEKLAVLFREKGARFEIPNFDARKEAEWLERDAAAIRTGSAAWKVAESGETLMERRDRAYTYADGAIAEIRAAARYAFRSDRDDHRLSPYVDSYRVGTNRRSRANRGEKKATAPAAAATATSSPASGTGSTAAPGQSPK